MSNPLIILTLVLLQFSCSSELNKSDIEYIKVITLAHSDSITLYNRGMSLQDYLYWNLQNDSVVSKGFDDKYSDYNLFAFSAKSNQGLKDTLKNLIMFLKGRPNGLVDSVALFAEGVYCGPTFYVELLDAKGPHYYTFILGGNDTLSKFSDFFYHSDFLPLEKRLLNKRHVNADSVAVGMMKALGYYEEMPIPYVGVSCDSTIDHSKIFGIWRTVSTAYSMDSNTYFKLTFKKNRTLMYQRVVNGSVRYTLMMRFEIAPRQNVLTLNSAGNEHAYNIIKLTENCFEYNDRGNIVQYNRY